MENEMTDSRLRAIIAGHEGLLGEALPFLEELRNAFLNDDKRDQLRDVHNLITRMKKARTGLYGDC